MDRQYFKNPFIEYLRWILLKIRLEKRNRTVRIGHLSKIRNVDFGKQIYIYNNCCLYNCKIGDFTYISSKTEINRTIIGKFCSIGPEVLINLSKHPTNFLSSHPSFYSTGLQCGFTFVKEDKFKEEGSVKIGNDVWIGARAIILSDINIGDGVVIAAGSVVTKDVEPYSIVCGVPARLLKKRFSDEEIKLLIDFKWWDKDIDWIKENKDYFTVPEEYFLHLKHGF